MRDYQLLVAQDPEPALLTLNSTIVACNEAVLNLLGCESAHNLKGNLLVEWFEDPQPDGSRVLETSSLLNSAQSKPKTYTFFLKTLKVKDHHPMGMWAKMQVHFLKKINQDKLFLIHVQELEQSESAQQNQKLEQEVPLFQNALWKSPDAVLKLSADFSILYANEIATAFLYDAENSSGQSLQQQLKYPEIWTTVKLCADKALKSGQIQQAEVYSSSTNQWLVVKVVPEKNNRRKTVNFVLQFTDVSEQKQQQIAQKQQRDSFKLMIESSLDVVTRYNRSFRHTFITSNVRKYMKVSPDEFLHKKVGELTAMPKHLLSKGTRTLRRLFKTGKAQRVLYQLVPEKWVEWYVVPVHNDKGEVEEALGFSRDMTHYKKIQVELKRNRHKMRFALNIAKLASFEVDPVKGAFLLDKSLAKVYGLPVGKAKDYQVNVFEFIDKFLFEHDRKKARIFFKQLLKPQTDAPEQVIYEYNVNIQGKSRYLIFKNKITRDENGEVKRWFGTVQDITDLRQKEEELITYRKKLQQLVRQRNLELQRSEDSLTDAMKLARLGTWEYDPLRRVFVGDEQVAEMLGIWKPGKKTYKVKVEDYLKLVHPLDYANFEAASRKAFHARSEDYVGHVEHRVTHPNGEVRYIYFSIKTLFDERKKRKMKFYGIAQDITSIWKLESEIETRSTIIETTPDIVCVFDKHFRLMYVNRSGKNKFNIGPFDDLLDYSVLQDDQLKSLSLIDQKVLNEIHSKNQWSGERELNMSKGMKLYMTGTVQKFNFQNQEAYLAIFRDISEQKKVERDLRFKKEELDTFVKRASEDLKGPISSLRGLNNVIESEVTDPKLNFYLAMFTSEVNKLQNILISLINITKIRREKLDIQSVEVERLSRNCLDELRKHPAFEQTRFNLDIRIHHAVNLDIHLYFIVLINLLKNALDFRKDDQNPVVSIKVYEQEGELVSEVQDNGQGMDEQVKRSAFQMFYRGNPASKGSGLGLYMVKNAVQKLGGQVELISEPGQGTTVRVKFPLKQDRWQKAA
jgi:PAS domain S-box-containing protein